MVIANATRPVVCLSASAGVGAQVAVEWVATGMNDGHDVAVRNDHLIGEAFANCRETQ